MIVTDVDDTWSADLVDMQAFAKYNKGIKYLLTIIDVFSKYAWVVPLKDKTGKSVTEAFAGVVGQRLGQSPRPQARHPNNLWVDEGTEFYNKTFKKFLEDNKINMYHTFNFGKAVVVERFNRTLKQIMWKYFTTNNTNTYLDKLPDMVNKYNNTKHSSTKMSPNEASDPKNKGKVYFNLYGGSPHEKENNKIGYIYEGSLGMIDRSFQTSNKQFYVNLFTYDQKGTFVEPENFIEAENAMLTNKHKEARMELEAKIKEKL